MGYPVLRKFLIHYFASTPAGPICNQVGIENKVMEIKLDAWLWLDCQYQLAKQKIRDISDEYCRKTSSSPTALKIELNFGGPLTREVSKVLSRAFEAYKRKLKNC